MTPSDGPPAHPREAAARWPDKPALIQAETGRRLTYRELVRRADQAGQLFAHCGVPEGGVIAILLENGLEFAELCWAAKNTGLYYVAISTHLNTPDLAYVLANSEASVLVTAPKFLDSVGAALAGLERKPLVLTIGSPVPGAESYEARLQAQPATPLAGRSAGASMLYSSGTTGRPKAVRRILEPSRPEQPPPRHKLLVERFGFAPDMVFINPGPLYHVAPQRMMMSALRLGATVVLFRKFEAAAVLEAIAAFGGTHGFFVPTMFVRMLRHRDQAQALPDLSSLRAVIHGAAPCAPDVKEAMLAWWGPIVHELYGGTEGIGNTSILADEWLRHRGSVGKPPAGARVRIVGPSGETLAPNQVGVIYFSNNGSRIEYWGDAAKTREAQSDDGYATLGDVGYLDEEGYLYLTDRLHDVIISGGVNIYPQEAENALSAHPEVEDVAVIGVPDAEFGEQVKAIVQPRNSPADPRALEADILAFCRERLSPIKCPRSVDFVDSLPRSETGKLLKRELRRRYSPA